MLRTGLVETYTQYDTKGRGHDVQGQDNAEMQELITTHEATISHLQTRALLTDLFVTLARVYYLLAGPRLAEAHDSSTVVPLTGSACSAPKPLTISNLLHSQHQSNDQHKDVMKEPRIKTQLAQFVSMNGQLLNVLPKGRYEAEGAGRRGMYKGGGTGRHNQDQDTSDTSSSMNNSRGSTSVKDTLEKKRMQVQEVDGE